MTTSFDPLKTRAEQGLAPLPEISVSLDAQRKLMQSMGLREVNAVVTRRNPNGVKMASAYITVEAVQVKTPTTVISNSPTACVHGIDMRGDRVNFNTPAIVEARNMRRIEIETDFIVKAGVDSLADLNEFQREDLAALLKVVPVLKVNFCEDCERGAK